MSFEGARDLDRSEFQIKKQNTDKQNLKELSASCDEVIF